MGFAGRILSPVGGSENDRDCAGETLQKSSIVLWLRTWIYTDRSVSQPRNSK